LIANYDPVSGAITGPVGALPIQTPVAPNGKNMVVVSLQAVALRPAFRSERQPANFEAPRQLKPATR
jgi:hypothetical protein